MKMKAPKGLRIAHTITRKGCAVRFADGAGGVAPGPLSDVMVPGVRNARPRHLPKPDRCPRLNCSELQESFTEAPANVRARVCHRVDG